MYIVRCAQLGLQQSRPVWHVSLVPPLSRRRSYARSEGRSSEGVRCKVKQRPRSLPSSFANDDSTRGCGCGKTFQMAERMGIVTSFQATRSGSESEYVSRRF